MLAGQHSAMLSGTACTWNIKGVVSDIFNENTRYFKDILQIYIYILYRFMARLEYYRYTTGILIGILEVDLMVY